MCPVDIYVEASSFFNVRKNSENKSRGLYFSKDLFEPGLFLEGLHIFGGVVLIYGGKFVLQNRLGLYLEGNLCLKIDWASILVEGNCIDVTV